MGKMIIKGRASGMFSETNCFLAGLAYADHHNLEPAISWARCRYSDKGVNGWPEFFHHIDSSKEVVFRASNRHPLFFNKFSYAAPRGPDLPQAYRKKYKCKDFMRPPLDRHKANEIIAKYIRPLPFVFDEVNQHNDLLGGARKVIGLHIRGPLRFHGGSIWLSDQLGKGHPPYEEYFRYVDEELGERDLIVLCTDAGCVVEKVIERYGDQVFVPSRFLPQTGEPHKTVKNASRHELGMDILSDAYILARSNVLIHGNSNVSNFVLCLSPDMRHHDIYAHLYPPVK